MPPDENTKGERVKPIVWGIYAALAVGGATWFILEKTNYDPTVASGLVTGIVSIIVGVIAAYVGAQTTLRATNKAHQDALDLQTQKDSAQIKGVLQALHAELSCLWFMYESEFGEDMEKLEPADPFVNYFKLGENYFSIFDSNSVFIGKIPDPKLRQSMVLAYLRLKSLVDSHHLNNRLQDEHTQLKNLKGKSEDRNDKALIEEAYTDWKDYSQQLKTTYLVAKQAVNATLQLLEQSGMLPSKALLQELSSSLSAPVQNFKN